MTDHELTDRLHSLPPDLDRPADRFEQISTRAHRRQVRRRALAGGAIAVVAAVAVAVPVALRPDGTEAAPAPVATDPATDPTTAPTSAPTTDPALLPPADFIERGRTLPGGTTIAPLSEPVVAIHDGPAAVELGPRPAGATAVEVVLECLSPGELGTAGGGGFGCSEDDMGRATELRSTWDTVTLREGQEQLRYPRGSMRWRVVTRYVGTRVLPLGVNAKGETFGVQGGAGRPDLVATIATNGRSGYVYQSDMEAADPMPSTPEEAAALDPDRGPFTVPVYESDGETRIGVFQIG